MFFARLITLAVTLTLGYLTYSAFFFKWMESIIGYPKLVGVPLAIILVAAIATFIALLGMEEEGGQLVISRDSLLSKFARFCMPTKEDSHGCDIFIHLVPLTFVAALCLLVIFGLGMMVKMLFTDPVGFGIMALAVLCATLIGAVGYFICGKVEPLINDTIKEIFVMLIAVCGFVIIIKVFIYDPIDELSKKHGSIVGGATEYALYFVFMFGVIFACMFFRKILRAGMPNFYSKVCRPIKA